MSVRVRFAPSPTGALHIGGIRTALYNYLFAKKHHGQFILRIEDTDRNRLVEGAEQYIADALEWVGILPDESPDHPGDYGPYRQSERQALYKECAEQLLSLGKAYMAFDSTESLEASRAVAESQGGAFLYGAETRLQMRNSLSLSYSEVQQLLEVKTPYTIRLKVDPEEEVKFYDLVRGWVSFNSSHLDDKVLFKTDGFPTYHLANVVDDYLMKISHVIRGEEWLSSTAHHLLIYKALDWEESIPAFSHLPLILKPTGKGKLSKRDGEKLGIPVFPLTWIRPGEVTLEGFREAGFIPEAVINFLCLLGWNPGTDQELMSLEEMINLFSIEKIGKSGARFDYEKAKWFNHQYISASSSEDLFILVGQRFINAGYTFEKNWLLELIGLFKERTQTLNDFVPQTAYFFNPVTEFDMASVVKKWNASIESCYIKIVNELAHQESFKADSIESLIKEIAGQYQVSFGNLFPALRVALTGIAKGPDLFKTIELLGADQAISRLKHGLTLYQK